MEQSQRLSTLIERLLDDRAPFAEIRAAVVKLDADMAKNLAK